jgi:hypothetical protein
MPTSTFALEYHADADDAVTSPSPSPEQNIQAPAPPQSTRAPAQAEPEVLPPEPPRVPAHLQRYSRPPPGLYPPEPQS